MHHIVVHLGSLQPFLTRLRQYSAMIFRERPTAASGGVDFTPNHNDIKFDRESHLPRDRHHGLPCQWRRARTRAGDAAHESPRTTKLYDRTEERLTQDEVER